jgi:hypothetical protein
MTAMTAALELAKRGEQPASRAQLRSAVAELPRCVTMVKSSVLIAAAGVAVHGGDAPRAARWLGCAANIGGIFTIPQGLSLYAKYLPMVRAALSAEDRRRERDAGRALALRDALEELAEWVTAM